MSDKRLICKYDDLVNNFNPPATEEWTQVVVENLDKGKIYFLPVYFWAPEARKIVVEFMGPNGKVVSRLKSVIDSGCRQDRKTWTHKRYKLDSSRHNGTAVMRFGMPKGDAKNPLSISLGALEGKIGKRQRLINDGRCPECGIEGQWVTMAMICKEHGAFLGG